MAYDQIMAVGKFRLDRHSKTNMFYISWNDRASGQRRRASLLTKDHAEAAELAIRVGDSGALDPRDFLTRAKILTVEDVLNADLPRKSELASAETELIATEKIIKSSIGKRRLASLTKSDFKTLNSELAQQGLTISSISRYLSALRSAITQAKKNRALTPDQIVDVPEFRTREVREAEEPKGIIATPLELAILFDNIAHSHARLAFFLLLATGARIGAILDLHGDQICEETGIINLNKKGRVQNNKFRPALPLSIIGKNWIESLDLPSGPIIVYRNLQVKKMSKAINGARVKGNLNPKINSYSVRYAILGWLRKNKVSTELIAVWAGHMKAMEQSRTTISYAPITQDDLRDITPLIDAFLLEVHQNSKLGILTPDELIMSYANRQRKKYQYSK